MRSVYCFWICLAMVAGMAVACKSTQPASTSSAPAAAEGPVLLDFDLGGVSQAEFERVYAKNNGGPEEAASHSPEQYREYLDLYVNFKRKVFEAEAMGLDTTPAFKQEFNTYRKQLAQPYLSAQEVEDQLIEEAYQRSQSLVNASHLLLSVSQGATPADTLAVYNRILALRDSIVNGQATFAEMAARHSEDPSAKDNQGELGYFSVFDMVYPFESAAFATAEGEVSLPVRTRYGYHLVKVNDRIANSGTKRAAHIIIRVGDRYSAKTNEQAEKMIQEIYTRLQQGEDFENLVKQYSDDPNSANRGGDLGTGRLLPDMETRKLQLEEGEVSEPFQTQFGWHILKVTEVEKSATLEESRPELKQKISRDSRSQLSRKALINRIKEENNYELMGENFSAFTATLDESFPRGTWKPDSNQAALYDKVLFSLNEGEYVQTVQDFIDDYLRSRSRRPGMPVAQAANELYEDFAEKQLLAYEEDQLPLKNPEFRYLLQEYRDGILLFTLMEQKVWKKAVEDSAGLKAFYQDNQSLFEANEMVDLREYRSSDREALEQVAQLLKEGVGPTGIDSALNSESALQVRIITQSYEQGKSELPAAMFDQAVGSVSDIQEVGDGYRIQVVEEKFPAGIKPFAKAKSEAITRYQDYLEAQWLEELAQKYPVEINEKAFSDLFQ